MEAALTVGLITGLVGGVVTVFITSMKSKKNESHIHHWLNISTDPGLNDLIIRLDVYQKYNQKAFLRIGSMFDNMVEQYNIVQSKIIGKSIVMNFRFYEMRHRINILLQELSESVLVGVDETSSKELSLSKKALLKSEFHNVADDVANAAKIYYDNMIAS